MRDLPRTGEIYRHFKGNRYEIMSIATDTETDEKQVVYRALYGEKEIFVRSLDMFMSEVDRDKYPDVSQKYRFEKETGSEPLNAGSVKIPVTDQKVDERLLKFLDAPHYEDKLRILDEMQESITEKNLIAMATSMDIELSGDTLEEQFDSLKKCISTRMTFEGSRLR